MATLKKIFFDMILVITFDYNNDDYFLLKI